MLEQQATACLVLNKETGEYMTCAQLRRHPKNAKKWERSFANETGRIFSSIGRNEDGQKRIKDTNKFFVIHFQDIPNTRINEVCYTSLLCQERPGKSDPNRTRITICGTNVQYTGDVGTKTASLELPKIIINSVISRVGAKIVAFHNTE